MRPARRARLWAALFSLILTQCVTGEERACVVHDNGKIYDLNPLKSKTDYELKTPTGHSLYLNICQSVKTETFGLKDDSVVPAQIGAFIRRDHGDFSIGNFNTSLSIFSANPRFTMTDGSQCASGASTTRTSSLVNLLCDTSVPGFGSPQLIAFLPPGDEDAACAFIIEWKTSYACGVSKTGTLWTIFTFLIVTFLILLAVYTILGTLYNTFVLKLKGLDSIPQFSLQSMHYHLSNALEWSKDVLGILLVNYCAPDALLPSHGSNHNPRTPNPVSHHAQAFGRPSTAHGHGHIEREQEWEPQRQRERGFVKPKLSSTATNPISHHTQSLSQTALSTPPVASAEQTHSQPTPPREGEERQFMLFSTDEREQEDEGGGGEPTIKL